MKWPEKRKRIKDRKKFVQVVSKYLLLANTKPVLSSKRGVKGIV